MIKITKGIAECRIHILEKKLKKIFLLRSKKRKYKKEIKQLKQKFKI